MTSQKMRHKNAHFSIIKDEDKLRLCRIVRLYPGEGEGINAAEIMVTLLDKLMEPEPSYIGLEMINIFGPR